MITEQHVKYLLGLPKKFIENQELIEEKHIHLSNPFSARIPLVCENEDEFQFLIDAKQSQRQGLKLSLHCQENSSNFPLIRVDFRGRHRNPEVVSNNVPTNFVPYAGVWLDDYPGHIHYQLDGYSPLAWAIPLEVDSFPVKRIVVFSDVTEAFGAFCKLVNVQTRLILSTQSDLLL